MRSDTRDAHLADTNYYRLLYHLAAQRLHAALDGGRRGKLWTHPERQALLEKALRTAQQLAADAEVELSSLQERHGARWWRPWGPQSLTLSERKLELFLAKTLLPCAVILSGGAYTYLDRVGEAEAVVGPLKRELDERGTSFRVYYNLACYEVGMAGRKRDRDRLNEGVEYFAKSLRLARGRRRDEVVRWAPQDPSLELLREDKEIGLRFRELVERFRSPEGLGSQKSDSKPR